MSIGIWQLLLLLLVALIVVPTYLLPWIIARRRGHPNTRAVFWLTVLTGWTAFGWVAMAVWAILEKPRTA